MQIIKRGKIEHFARCNKCGTEMIYDKHDLYWTHIEEDRYFIVCPTCGKTIWLEQDSDLGQMYNEAVKEGINKK